MGKNQFGGFSMPEGSYFPPELRELLPDIDTLSEVKVLLCVLDRYFQAGLDALPMTLKEIEQATGLSRYGANEGLKRARARGSIKRLRARGTFAYEPSLRIRLPCMHDSLHPSSSESSSETEHDHASRSEILKILVVEFGVASRVADDVAFHRDPVYVQKHIDYARYEIQTVGFTPKNPAGFIIARIRDDWPPPLGFEKPKEKRWYTDAEFEQFFEH